MSCSSITATHAEYNKQNIKAYQILGVNSLSLLYLINEVPNVPRMRSSWSDWILRFCMDWPFIKTSDSNRFDGIWLHSVRLLELAQVIILQNMKQRQYVRRISNNICQGENTRSKKGKMQTSFHQKSYFQDCNAYWE